MFCRGTEQHHALMVTRCALRSDQRLQHALGSTKVMIGGHQGDVCRRISVQHVHEREQHPGPVPTLRGCAMISTPR
jgi:hypothetical protein